jgi:DNA-binding FadR family transcriptional regulator
MIDQFPSASAVSSLAGASRVTDADLAVARLRGLIAQARFKPGDRIPPERELIERLGVTRATLRRALDALERDGLIWRHVGKGTFLCDGAARSDEAGLAALARRTTPVKMMQARLAVESAIAREAAINASGEALDAIAAAATGCRKAADWAGYEAADDRFHRAVALAADNLPLLAVFDQLNAIRRTVAWGHVKRSEPRPGRDHTSLAEHDRIARAITDRDAEAAQDAMRGHLRSVSARLFGA